MGFLVRSLLFIILLNVVVNADIWSLSGRVSIQFMHTFAGRPKIRVELISGGTWDSVCGDAIAHSDGKFHIVCQAPFHVLYYRHLAIYHRFRNGQCYRQYIKDIEDNQVFELMQNDKPALESQCPTEKYDAVLP